MNEKAIIVGLNIGQSIDNYRESMMELSNLCSACDIDAVGEIIQKGNRIHPKYFIGQGKTDELIARKEEYSAELIVFNHELTSLQIRNLEELTNAEVMDRTALILNIFSRRARTREAKLQVEVARLQYELPRLTHTEQDLGRQGGGVGTKNRGSGEKKLELDRRRIIDKITQLNKELETLHKQRSTRSSLRDQSAVKKAALVGYTNAGKSTVMNELLARSKQADTKQVLQQDMLFATLDTSTRNISVDGYGHFLLSDTVGFIGDLPHSLVKAFRSTLQEVKDADLLIHVIDISNPSYKHQKQVTEQTLQEIGATDIPILCVYNKIDKAANLEDDSDAIFLSALNGEGIDDMLEAVSDNLYHERIKCDLLLPYTMGDQVSSFKKQGNILNLEYRDEGYYIRLKCEPNIAEKYKEYCIGSYGTVKI